MVSTQSKSHPRRIAADKSVSLLHQPRTSSHLAPSRPNQIRHDSSASGSPRNPVGKPGSDSNSPSSLNPLTGKQSPGDSSSAEKWFDKSNNTVAGTSEAFSNNDPPYFLRNPSSEEQVEGQPAPQQYLSPNDFANSLQLRTGLMQLGTDASSTEDFRSVIDDLTIENKKLKRKLKKYEKLHDSHLRDEKLFEVRIHGLPSDKKRELEETLRQFATQLNPRGGAELPSNVYLGVRPSLDTHKTTSSSTSLPNTDSAYASMSTSGRDSSSGSSKNRKFAQSALSRHQNIHSYLHHIPEGLMPSQNPQTMTERSKKKLVVRRLEQIFAGKGAAASGHQQALQQQDVSNSAAHADRIELEAQGQSSGKEGIREAIILPRKGEQVAAAAPRPSDANVSASEQSTSASESRVLDGASQQPSTTAHSPNPRVLEQRPTRPLDLDPHRAQVPTDNMRYMRHLGFTVPDPGAGSPEDDEGWIYLNLLVGMAQLHTISVSNEFVRKAVDDFSTKLEMSEDGRKLRWKGGTSLTRTSSTGGESIREGTDADSSQSPRKRIRLNTAGPRSSARSRHVPGSRTQHSENGRLAYTPMFFHKESTSDEESSSETDEDDDNNSSQFPQHFGGNSSGMTSSGIRTTVVKNKRKHNDGPIIFYNNARFCTDLSGDTKSALGPGAPIYKAASVSPIGAPKSSTVTTFFEKRGPLAHPNALRDATSVSNDSSSDSMVLDFPLMSAESTSSSASQSPMDLEVTGIGGVYPSDNFAIAVESRRAIIPEAAQPAVAQSTHAKVVPPRLVQLLKTDERTYSSLPVKITARHTDLLPSALPPALNYIDGDSDSASDGGSDDDDDDMSNRPDSFGALPSMAAPQPMDMMFDDSEDSDADMRERLHDDGEDADVDDDAESDGSLDLLAAARVHDPEAVRAREREYDANMAERLAEEIPAGSSAATAGGGSGFASPVSVTSETTYQEVMNAVRANRRPGMPKRRTADSMAVEVKQSSSEEGDGSLIRS